MELKKLLESRKAYLDPLVKEKNAVTEKFQTLETKYNIEKQKYDSAMTKIDNEKRDLTIEVEKLEVFSES